MMDVYKKSDCIACGFCCSQGTCGYGRWDKARKCCEMLSEPNEYGQRMCRLYVKIVEYEKDSSMPMFGCGCTSVMFNDVRLAVARELGVANVTVNKYNQKGDI